MFENVVRWLGRRNALIAVAVVGIPVIEAWWSLFTDAPIVPAILGDVNNLDIAFGINPWGILAPPILLLVILGITVYAATKPTQPFTPDRVAGSETVGSYPHLTTIFHVRIDNGVAGIFHGCYARIVSCTRVEGSSQGILRPGDQLIWGRGNRARETLTFTSMTGEDLVLAEFDSRDPEHFKVPIGLNTYRTMERHGPYQVAVEVGSSRTSSIPTKFSFVISEDNDTIAIGRIDQIED